MNKSIAIYETGSAVNPPVLLIHGNSVHSGFFSPLTCLLEPRYHILTLDLPGHNQSEAWDKSDFTRENLALLFNAVLDYFGIAEVAAFGFSMGGFLLLESFDLVPAIKKIAIAGHPPLRSMADMTAAYHLNEDSALFLQGILSENEIERLYQAVIRIGNIQLKSEIKDSIRETSPSFRDGCLNLAQHAGDQIDKLNRFHGSVAIIHAADDLAVQLQYLEQMKIRNLWEQQIQVIRGCGHFIIVEKPVELAAVLDRFFVTG
ncbi:MAG: alpha/beta hydrolase [Bacteroidetes bacterium]|nr:alpha/beta hydrolase [Bacteroidota bacterium]